ncbi:helix-turn-helix domain-containing protein [Alkalicoccobacillus porphyridii]|uniref:ABC transporter substrate-binding protein n=1 Tax=Alkalicoccobacillus porphyridii TaxID=2597270 RepID=A0A554A0Z6_9BACI|nr:ABC transporter substrate-binding protein [Alkalicoccobacillus porphyridii]TSB47370.1 ABC transporter substrate-binding protein [Alkalicoccobacillus porphyridii]
MQTNENLKKDLSAFLYTLESATYFETTSTLKQEQALHSLIILKEPTGWIDLNGDIHHIDEDSIFFLHADIHKQQMIQFQQRVSGYHFQFFSLKDKGKGNYEASSLACPQKLVTAQSLLLQSKAQEVMNHQTQDKMMSNILFQTLIHTLLNELKIEKSVSIEQLIHKSREYIDNHYQLEITREQLAQMTGLNADYYSRKFKQRYQKSPIAYLNDVRLRQAKQRLIQTNEPIRSIAKQVGFSDEFYFSRKFKAKEGSSPTIYINKLKQSNRVASLNHLVTGHSIALGLEPYAAIRNDSFPITIKSIEIGHHQPNLERLFTVKPDLIVRCATADQKQTTKDELYNQIAPTVTLAFQDSWQKNLGIVARLVNREQEAKTFLETYHQKAEIVSKQIKQSIGSGSVLILGIGEGSLCIYGKRNLGTVLYNDLHISQASGFENIDHLKVISLHELSMINPDHILLTIYRDKHRLPSKQAIRKQLLQLQQSAEWASLRAVKHNRIYSILDTNHLYTSYNAYSNSLFLNKMNQLLVNGQ